MNDAPDQAKGKKAGHSEIDISKKGDVLPKNSEHPLDYEYGCCGNQNNNQNVYVAFFHFVTLHLFRRRACVMFGVRCGLLGALNS